MEDPFIGRITEFYEKEDKSPWFAAQWFFRTYDTVSCQICFPKLAWYGSVLHPYIVSMVSFDLHRILILLTNVCLCVGQGMAKEGRHQDPKRIFYSDVMDDNELHVIVGKISIVRVASKVWLTTHAHFSKQHRHLIYLGMVTLM